MEGKLISTTTILVIIISCLDNFGSLANPMVRLRPRLDESGAPQPHVVDSRLVGANSSITITHYRLPDSKNVTLDDKLEIVQLENECQECKQLREEFLTPPTDEELQQARKQAVLRAILSKLRLAMVPNITLNNDIPEKLKLEVEDASRAPDYIEEDFYAAPAAINYFSQQVYDCTNPNKPDVPSVCVKIPIKDMEALENMESAHLNMHYKPLFDYDDGDFDENDHPIVLSLYDITAPRDRNLIYHHVVNDYEDWINIDVKHTILKWQNISRNALELQFKIKCHKCSGLLEELSAPRHKPYLTVNVKRSSSHRTRRSNNRCGSSNNRGCCLKDFYVSFADEGWDFISSPNGFWANYCDGSCVDVYNLPSSPHSHIISSHRRHKRMRACCTATKMSPISILYNNDSGSVVKYNLPDMKVDECKCDG